MRKRRKARRRCLRAEKERAGLELNLEGRAKLAEAGRRLDLMAEFSGVEALRTNLPQAEAI